MSQSRAPIIFIVITILILSFFLGYRYGYRDTENDLPSKIEYPTNSLPALNSLSQIKFQPFFGPYPTTDINSKDFRGYLLYVPGKPETEVRINLKQIPAQINLPGDKKNNIASKTIEMPQTVSIELGKLNSITKNIDFLKVADIKLDPPLENTYSTDFSFVVKESNGKNFPDYDLIFIYDSQNASQNLYEFNLDDYPNVEESKKRPFLWSYINKF